MRKGQEFVLTLMLEALLPKQRILELYLNHVEWGEGILVPRLPHNIIFLNPLTNLVLGKRAA